MQLGRAVRTMDSEAVDSCIQRSLSALYPPFEETAGTLLGQVFDVLEKTFRHDALRYVIDFFIPAKHILETIQQQACAEYQGCLFLHQGWPLCLGEQLVVQLSALDWRALQPEDFYLQLAPRGSRGATLLLKCRAWGVEQEEEGGGIIEVPIPEDAYPHLFTAEWLDGVNRELQEEEDEEGGGGDGRGGRPPRRLSNCLLAAAGGRLRRMRWSRLVCPRLRDPAAAAGRPRASGDGAAAEPEEGDDPLHLRPAAAAVSTDKNNGERTGDGRDPTYQEHEDGGEGGEYVELREITTRADPLTTTDDAAATRRSRLRSSTLPAFGSRAGRRRRAAQAQHRAWVHQPRRRRRQGACAGVGEGHGRGGADAPLRAVPQAHVGRTPSPGETEPTGPPDWGGVCDVEPTPWLSHWRAEGGSGDGALSAGRSASLAERGGPIVRSRPWLAGKGALVSGGVHSLAEPGESTGGGLLLAEPVGGTGLPLVERDGGTIEPGISLPRQLRPTVGAAEPLAGEGESAGAETSLAEPGRSPLGLEASLAGQGVSVIGAEQPLAEWWGSAAVPPPLAGQDRPAFRAELPRAEPEIPTAGTDRSLIEQGRSITEGEQPQGEQPTPSAVAQLSSAGPAGSKTTLAAEPRLERDLPSLEVGGQGGTVEEAADDTLESRQALGPSECRGEVAGPSDHTALTGSAPNPVPADERGGRGSPNEVRQEEEAGETGLQPDGGAWQEDNNRELAQEGSDEACPTGNMTKTRDNLEDLLPRPYCNSSPHRSHASMPQPPKASLHHLPDDPHYNVSYQQRPVSPSRPRSVSPSHPRPASPSRQLPVSPSHPRPVSPSHPRPVSPPHPRPTSPSHPRPVSPSHPRPVSPSCQVSDSPSHPWPVSPSHPRPTSPSCEVSDFPSHARPVSPSHPQPTSPSCQVSDSPSHLRPVSPSHPRPDSPSCQLSESPSRQLSDRPSCQLSESLPRQLADPPSHQHPESPSRQLPDSPSRQLLDSPSCQASEVSSLRPPTLGVGDSCFKMQKTPSTQDQAFPIGHYPANLLKLDMEIIHSGVLCLPGNRDRNGRALILATTENAVWESPRCSSTQLASILTYYYAISKKEVQNEGFRILLDARERQPAAALRRALHVFQKTVHGGIHSILVLAAKESSVNTEVLPGVQTETLTSIRSLHKYVEPAQLTPSFAGGFLYSNEKWVRYRLRLESLLYACRTSVHFLRRTSDQLEAKQLPNSAKEIPALIEEDEMLMGQVLQDARLIGLQQEGAAILVKLKRETISICGSDSYMPDLDVTCALYNQVDEELHRLVQISNRRQRDLEKLARFWRFEDQYRQVSEWLRDVGEPGLDKCEMVGDSLPVLRTKQREFQDLNHVALGYCQKADVLLGDMVHWESGASPQLQSFADKLHGYRTQLADFTRRAEQSRLSIDRAIRQHNAEDNGTPDSSRTPARASTDPRLPLGPRQEEGRPHPQTAGPRVGETHRGTDQEGEPGIGRAPRDRVEPPLPAHSSSTPDVRQCSSLAWGSPLLPPPPQSRCPLKKTRSFDLARQLTPHTPAAGGGAFSQRALSEPGDGRTSSRGGAGVLIRGLEVSSTELADRTCSPKEHVMLGRPRAVLADSPWGSSPPLEQQAKGSKARWVLAEALAAEQDYVCCLEHVVGSYSPEMERPDVPQELRGKRALVFGNLDKLLAFHQQLLLPQLWACLEQPLGIGDCFLRHKEHFAMYALYIRNKPQSDALLARHGSAFFKRRQLCLGDRMDLGSYLQMPIRRMMRYVALLQDLMAESSTENAQDVRSLRAALEMVQFQLRHGDNLVAMDAIRECDVNLKEQGQLLRRDRFTVWCGRRKSVRQVFLFEQLIVFTKVKRVDGGPETYVCKSSLKTADVGLTENIGESGLRFEVWYRRRRSNETYVFQAETADVKQAWTRDIAQILWRQASRNKELRLQEMLSTGMGSKLGLDCLGTADAMHWPPADCAPTEKEKITSE